MPTATPQRDAARSRTAILDAAEALFAARGYAATSLGEIATAAGLSRATPSYFFGGKEPLYAAVLERAFADRERAAEDAMQPVRAWARTQDVPLADPLRTAVARYVDFLLGRPAFVRLLAWEALDGGRRLQATPRASRALGDGFAALRDAGRPGLDVGDAVLLFVSLTFAPLTMRDTLLTTLGRDLGADDQRERHIDLVVTQLLHLLDGA